MRSRDGNAPPTPPRVRRIGLRALRRTAGVGPVTYDKGRKRLKFVVNYLDGKVERIRGFENRNAAADFREARIRLATALPDGVDVHTFADAALQYLDPPYGRAVEKWQLFHKHVMPVFGELQLHRIEDEQVNRFHEKIGALGYCTAHRDRIVRLFHECVACVRLKGWLEPGHTFPPPRFRSETTASRRAWARGSGPAMPSLAVLEKLLGAAEGYLEVVIVLAARAGLRIGEILALEWGDVNLRRGLIFIQASVSDRDRVGRRTCSIPQAEVEEGEEAAGADLDIQDFQADDGIEIPGEKAEEEKIDPNKLYRRLPKTDSSYRHVRITPAIREVLMRHRPKDPKATDRVVFGPGQRQLPARTVYMQYRRLQVRLGLARSVRIDGRRDPQIVGGYTMHHLRHAAVALMIFARVPLAKIMKAIGHSKEAMTLDVYGYLIKLRDEGASTWPEVPQASGEAAQAAAQPAAPGLATKVIGGRVLRFVLPVGPERRQEAAGQQRPPLERSKAAVRLAAAACA